METQVGKWETVASNLQTSYVLHQSASSSNFSCLCPAKSKGRVVSVVASSRELDDITTNSWSVAWTRTWRMAASSWRPYLDSIAVPLFSNPNYSETSKLVYPYPVLFLLGVGSLNPCLNIFVRL